MERELDRIRATAKALIDAGRMSGRYEALTSIRGIAAWWVVIYHFRFTLSGVVPLWVMAVFDRGYLAVDMFFVLSGFVIGFTYRTWFEDSVQGACGRFLGLRLARIYPLHVAVLAIFLVNPLVVYLFSSRGDLSQYPWHYFLQSLALVQAWGLSSGTAWNVPAWSISAEFFVYIIFPLMAFGAARVVRGPLTAVIWILTPLGVVFLGPALFAINFVDDIGRFAVVRCLLEFAAGFGVMRLRAMLPCRAISCYPALGFGFVVLGFVVTDVLPDRYAPFAFAALIFALADPERAPAQWLGSGNPLGRFLLALGAVSYATYLCHFLIRSWVKFVLIGPNLDPVGVFAVYISVTAVASTLLFLLVERPGRRWGRAFVDVLAPRVAVSAS
jgi:peptidoglycan/LPS O-acetylase OafA/YrhL